MASRLYPMVAVAAVLLVVSVAVATGPGGWDHLGTGAGGADSLNGHVYAFHFEQGGFYVGGAFTDAGGVAAADRIATWNGTSWAAVTPAGPEIDNGSVWAITEHNGKLYVGGTFQNAGGPSGPDYLAVWDGLTWGTACNGTGIGGNVTALQKIGNTLFVGGEFQNGAGIAEADYLLACDLSTGNSSATTSDPNYPFSGPVYALTADSDGRLYAGGRFNNLENILAADNVAYRDSGGWQAMGSSAAPCGCAVDGFVRALTAAGTDVYVGTDVKNVGGPVADNVIKWNGTGFSALGANTAGTDGWFPTTAYVYALAAHGGRVFAGGSWQDANGDARADSIAYLEGDVWRPLGSDGAGNGPLNATVSALAVQPFGFQSEGPLLFAGGSFTSAGGDAQANRAASFRLAQFDPLPTPTPTPVPPPPPTPTPTPVPTPVPTPTAVPTPPPDTTDPQVTGLKLASTEFRAAPSGSAISAAATVGTKVSFALSEPGVVRFTVEKPATGRRVGSRCVKQRPANRRRRACKRWEAVKGSAATAGLKGTNRVSFRGRMGAKTLRPGSYRLVVRATDAAKNASAAKRLAFRIVR